PPKVESSKIYFSIFLKPDNTFYHKSITEYYHKHNKIMKSLFKSFILLSIAATLTLSSCKEDIDLPSNPVESENFVGAVYAMANGSGQVDGQVQGSNSIVAYGRSLD
ncbi:MAG: hypothetical protein AAGK97_05995, partial [Bacteroidota bacterium]